MREGELIKSTDTTSVPRQRPVIREPLTKRQREIFDFLSQHIQERGYAPSLEEVGTVFGLRSLATVWKHLEGLHEKGYIKRLWGRSRQITIAPAPDHCQTCGQKLPEKTFA